MAEMQGQTKSEPYASMAGYALLDALLERRSRRFGRGMALQGGLAYQSAHPPQPLSVEEEAALAFAACGITGPALAELPFKPASADSDGGGNVLIHLIGRTVASGDAAHLNAVFVINDAGAWMLRRPQDYPRAEIAGLAQLARERRLVELYERGRVRVADARVDVPRRPPYVPPFNRWSANLPGTSYFLPIAELTAIYINILLIAFDDEMSSFIVDERNGFRPAGLARFARSRGGHLDDDPRSGRVGTVGFSETWLYEFSAIEQGGILQNLGLMAEALGLGGFAHFAAYPATWPEALGFRMEQIPLARTIGAGPLLRTLLDALGRNLPVPTPVGLERGGEVLIKPFCPPYYRSMAEAVRAFVDYKYAQGRGTLRDGGAASAWRDPAAVQASIPPCSDRAVDATIAYCEYIYQRYGRFPANSGPFRTVLAYQAHHLDSAFYERYYRS